jgi:tetratricopeptide (TPR) repeat protein
MLFAGLLVPALGFFDVYPFRYSFVADHFQYHATTAGLAALAAAGGRLAAGFPAARRGLRVAAVIVCGLLAVATVRQTGVYHDLETLCRDTMRRNPSSWAARNILGAHYNDSHRFADAEVVYRELIARPDLPAWPHDLAMFHYNHGQSLEGLGRPAEAETAYRAAIALDSAYAKPRNQLAKLLADTGRRTEAIAEYEALLRLPLDAGSRSRYAYNQGTVFAESGEWPNAEASFRRALADGPGSAECLEWLGISLLRQSRVAEARQCFTRALVMAGSVATRQRLHTHLETTRRLVGQEPRGTP